MLYQSSIGATAMAALLSALTVSAIPTPQSSTGPIYPPTELGANFRLVANVTGADLVPSINNYVLTSYQTGGGTAYTILVANTTLTTGRIFYVNGTATEVEYHESNVLSDAGTPPFPAGLAVAADNDADGERYVSLDSGPGQAGILLTQFPDPIHELGGGAGLFYACQNTMPDGEVAIQLESRAPGAFLPKGCVDITLLPQCSEGSGRDAPFGNNVNCYPDVAGIDWTYYSTD